MRQLELALQAQRAYERAVADWQAAAKDRCGSALVLARPRHQGEDERCTACDHDGGDLSKVFHTTESRAKYTRVHQGRLRRSAD